MLVVFRVDASLQMGTGHVTRCLTLADALATNGIKAVFISRVLKGHLNQLIRERGYTVYSLRSPTKEYTPLFSPRLKVVRHHSNDHQWANVNILDSL